jgi:transcriptional regulator with XRE-family HTH domain
MGSEARTKKWNSKLAWWRDQVGLTQQQLADRAGIELKMYQRLERKEIANPGIRPYFQLAEALGVTLEELLEPEWRQPKKGPRKRQGLAPESPRRPLS